MKPRRIVSALVGLLCIGAALPATANADDLTANVIGGRPASENYSFMVGLHQEANGTKGLFCTAVLVDPQWVATANHCLPGQPFATAPLTYSLRIGTLNRDSGGTEIKLGLNRIVKSPPKADLSLIKLPQRVKYRPVAIATTTPEPGATVRTIGWGRTCNDGNDPKCRPQRAHEVDQKVLPKKTCADLEPEFQSDVDLCVSNEGGIGSCYGDSGGPVVTKVNGRWELAGTVHGSISSQPECGTGYDWKTDIAASRDWIKTTIANN